MTARAVQGDQDALTELLSRQACALRERVARLIPKRWQSLLSAEDVLQETYTDAYLAISRYVDRGKGSFLAWLTAIGRNNLVTAVNMLEAEKRGGKRQRVTAGAPDESFLTFYEGLGAVTTTPSRAAAKIEARQAVRDGLAKLPEHYRQVIQMYDLEGWPVDDVAEFMGRSPGAVFMIRARSHRMLQQYFGLLRDDQSSFA